MSRRKRPSPWLAEARADSGIFVPAHPSAHGVGLRLSADHVTVGDPSTGLVQLSWDDLASPEIGRHARTTAWSITSWSSGRSGEIGIGLAVEGHYVAATESIRRARRSWRNRINRFLQEGVVVPLCAVGHISLAIDRDRQTVQMLSALLVLRPDLRPGLSDDDRVGLLLSDLRATPLGVRSERTGLRRASTEVLAAMRVLGYQHRFHGRPLPDDQMPPLDEVVTKVIERVRSNPYAKGVEIERSNVEQLVRRNYLDVEPWPVGALL